MFPVMAGGIQKNPPSIDVVKHSADAPLSGIPSEYDPIAVKLDALSVTVLPSEGATSRQTMNPKLFSHHHTAPVGGVPRIVT
jgi:hypothetical protein